MFPMYSALFQFFDFSHLPTDHLLRNGFLLVMLGLSQTAHAVSPPPDGGYPFNNTAEGGNALFKNTTGNENTANGVSALASNTTGSNNTATGFEALFLNTTGSSKISERLVLRANPARSASAK